jgi:magnesium-protoporphyrin O-methyltransferase
MNCCLHGQCLGIQQVFDHKTAQADLRKYIRKGPSKTTRLLLEAIQAGGCEGKTLLDIGGGVGAIPHELLANGAQHAVCVDASPAYLAVARKEAERRGFAQRITFCEGNFVDLVDTIEAVDIVTLDRVICCYNDMPSLVNCSLEKAREVYGLVYPRDDWWIRVGFRVANFFLKIRGNPFRVFAHFTEQVDGLIRARGFRRVLAHKGWFWQVVVYQRGNTE